MRGGTGRNGGGSCSPQEKRRKDVIVRKDAVRGTIYDFRRSGKGVKQVGEISQEVNADSREEGWRTGAEKERRSSPLKKNTGVVVDKNLVNKGQVKGGGRRRRLSKSRVPSVVVRMEHGEGEGGDSSQDDQTRGNVRIVTLYPSDRLRKMKISLRMKEGIIEGWKTKLGRLQERRRKVEVSLEISWSFILKWFIFSRKRRRSVRRK